MINEFILVVYVFSWLSSHLILRIWGRPGLLALFIYDLMDSKNIYAVAIVISYIWKKALIFSQKQVMN